MLVLNEERERKGKKEKGKEEGWKIVCHIEGRKKRVTVEMKYPRNSLWLLLDECFYFMSSLVAKGALAITNLMACYSTMLIV